MIYIFKHPLKEEYIEVVMGINEVHEYRDTCGVKWDRVFTAPQVAVSTRIDPFSQRSFIEKTGSSKGTVGDMMDRSRELSEKRQRLNGGVDPVKAKFFRDYSKRRKNKLHPSDPRRYKKLAKMGVGVNFQA